MFYLKQSDNGCQRATKKREGTKDLNRGFKKLDAISRESVGLGIRDYEIMRGRVLFPLGVTFCHWIFAFML